MLSVQQKQLISKNCTENLRKSKVKKNIRMFCTKTFGVTLFFVLSARCSIADRPNYLTDEDFVKARLLPSASNGTIFTPPHYRKDQPVRIVHICGYTNFSHINLTSVLE